MKSWPLALWLAALAFCAWVVAGHTRFGTDMAAFLPDAASPAQQLMVGQLRDGVATRLLLIAVEGGETEPMAQTSRKLVRALQGSGDFNYVRNGEQMLTPAERERLQQYRYLLSPQVNAQRFSVAGLRQALQDSLQLLSSPAGPLVKRLLPADPTGEMLALLDSWGTQRSGPAMQHGVWFSHDGKRALLLAETRAAGFDIEAQQQVQQAVRQAFDAQRSSPQLTLLLSGPSVFAVQSRDQIHHDAWRLSLLAIVLVSAILLLAYGSPRLLMLGMVPVASGALAGLAAVSLGYGSVHGITLGFGATLIGEAVDYPTYLFTQRAPGEALRATLLRIGPTLRLAVLTTVFGSLTMLLSGFSGLSQLGMFTLSGVLAAGLVTQYVLPEIAPRHFDVAPRHRTQRWLAVFMNNLASIKWLPLVVLAASLGYLASQAGSLWENDLANLSPVAEPAKQLDNSLRSEMGAPDLRFLIALHDRDPQQALLRSEQLVPRLEQLVQQGVIAAYDLSARVSPSRQTQAARQAALPDQATLRHNLQTAAEATPFKSGIFEPFLQQVEASRHLPLLQTRDWHGTPLGSLAESLLVKQGDEWVALISLRHVRDQEALQQAVAGWQQPGAYLLDIKAESNGMILHYRNRALGYFLLGMVAIAIVLGFGLRRGSAVFAVMLPVTAAIMASAALLVSAGVKLSLFHIVSLLLVLGTGLNYGLFFHRPATDEADRQRSLFSVLVCLASTVSAFGVLAFSATPVLRAIGSTVAVGAVLSFLLAAMWTPAQKHKT